VGIQTATANDHRLRDERSSQTSGRYGLGNGHVAFRCWASAHIPGLKFVETSEHDLAYGPHLHDFMEIIWVRHGTCEIISHDSHCAMRRGDMAIILPNEVHAGGGCGKPFRFTTLHIPRDLLIALFGANYKQEHCSLQKAPVLLLDGNAAESLYRDLVDTLPNTLSLGDQLTCLQNVLGRLFQTRKAAALPGISLVDRHPAVMQVLSVINREFMEPIDFRRLAAEVNLHQHYLISLFKAITGIPPHQYQIALRVELGRSLLDSDQPLSRVACMAGFADQSHFNRHFKRVYGLTPGMFREHTVPI